MLSMTGAGVKVWPSLAPPVRPAQRAERVAQWVPACPDLLPHGRQRRGPRLAGGLSRAGAGPGGQPLLGPGPAGHAGRAELARRRQQALLGHGSAAGQRHYRQASGGIRTTVWHRISGTGQARLTGHLQESFRFWG